MHGSHELHGLHGSHGLHGLHGLHRLHGLHVVSKLVRSIRTNRYATVTSLSISIQRLLTVLECVCCNSALSKLDPDGLPSYMYPIAQHNTELSVSVLR